MISVVGILLLVIAANLPASEVASPTRTMILDEFLPKYHFNEFHSTRVHAPPDSVYAAARQVTAREIRLFRFLTWIRSPRLGGAPESILTPPADDPVLDVALRSGFQLLADAPPREIVFGLVQGRWRFRTQSPTPQDFKDLNRAGYVKIAMNFHVSPDQDGWTTLTTETRVLGTDVQAKRRFGRYWRVIYPGSAIIRVMWLRAIKSRAERR
ncbi:MAG: hypothetical protein M3O61_08565 [Gemmatimonadota bacterium]|nr:hypothetical protein [Gemmatimonadota bacterium]